MTTQPKQQVAIIGAGIIGLCCGLQLQKRGYEVTIIDKQGVAQGASKGNAGHFATEQVFPLADPSLLPQVPKMLIDPLGPFRIRLSYLFKAIPWFSRFLLNMLPKRFNANKEAIKQLNVASIAAYQEMLADLQLTDLLILNGSLLVSEVVNNPALQRAERAFKKEGVNVEFLSQKQLQQLEPDLSNNVKCALRFKDVGHTIEPEQFCQRLFDAFQHRGGNFIKSNISQIKHGSASVTVNLGDLDVDFNKLIIACGAWSKPLANQLGYRVPLDTERGYHLMLPGFNQLKVPVASFERKFIMTPMTPGLRLAGTVEFAGLDAPANEQRAKALLPHASELLKEQLPKDNNSLPSWMGFRPSLPDSLPVLGQAPNHQNIYFAFGHQHLGLTQGAISGKLLAQQIAGEPTTINLSAYNISRFN